MICQLNLFGHALHPQSQNLLVYQPIIIVIWLASFNSILSKASLVIMVMHVPSGTSKVLLTPHWGGNHQGSEIWADITIQLDQLGQWDSLGKPTGDIEQEGLAWPSLPSSLA